MSYPHNWVHCSSITKRLKVYSKIRHASGPLHFAGKITSSSPSVKFPRNWRKYSATNIGQIIIHSFILRTWKRSLDGCVMNNLLWPTIAVITDVTRMDTPEWLSLQSLPDFTSLAAGVALCRTSRLLDTCGYDMLRWIGHSNVMHQRLKSVRKLQGWHTILNLLNPFLFCLFVCLFACLFVCLFVCWGVCLLGCLFVCLLGGVFVCLFVCLIDCLFVCCLFVCLFFTFLSQFGNLQRN